MQCLCADKECPVGHMIPGGAVVVCPKEAMTRVYRIDMEDESGTPMCYGCAADAIESGVFRSEGSRPEIWCSEDGSMGVDWVEPEDAS